MLSPMPPWLESLHPFTLEPVFGVNTVRAGQDYARQGRVSHINRGGGPAETVLQASVRGSQGRDYVTVVRRTPTGRLSNTCSCPVRSNCKHGVAVLFAAKDALADVAGWQRALGQVARMVRDTATTTPLGLMVERDARSRILLRPVTPGAGGRWIKSGVGFVDLQRQTAGFDPRQRRLMLALHEARPRPVYGRQDADIALSETRPQVWPIISELQDAGVPIIAGPHTPDVRISTEPAVVVTRALPAPSVNVDATAGPRAAGPGPDDAAATPSGDLLLHTCVQVGEELWSVTNPALIGEPPHGVMRSTRDEIVLAPFAEPLSAGQRAMLLQHPRVTVPAADVGLFAAGYLPDLRRILDVEVDDAVELPELAPPRLLLTVGFGPEHLVELDWGYAYAVGDEEVHVGVDPRQGDPVVRDGDEETRLAEKLPERPWARERRLDGTTRPPRSAQLRGGEAAEFATTWLPVLRAEEELELVVLGEVPAYRHTSSAPLIEVSLRDSAAGGSEADAAPTDWFDLDVRISVDGEQIDFRELFGALARGETHLILDSGTWFSLDRPELDQLRTIIAEAERLQPGGEQGLRLRSEHAGLWDELVQLGVVTEQSAAWRTRVAGLLDMGELPDPGDPAGLDATLRPYQREGFRWLSHLWSGRLGGILADDMGLGKTVQLLATILWAREAEPSSPPVLVIAPTSVLATWAKEAARFTPGLRVEVVDRTARKRDASLAAIRRRSDIVVTSYTLLRLEEADYVAAEWDAVVLDEAQFVKNSRARIYKAVRRLRARARFAVTGTPLENNLMDLWSLLSITAPGMFVNPETFADLYRKPIEAGDSSALARLRRRVRPLLLRRTKADVASDLPPKQEQQLDVELAPAHRRVYDRQLAAERRRILGLVDDLDHNRVTILSALTRLRQLSLSPALVDPSLPAASAKIDTLLELVEELSAEGHRALVFSQFTSFLALVRSRLDAERIGYRYLDGTTRRRSEQIAAFRNGTEPVFLISLKAGGFGLTLTEADYVFILDPWWNPAAENQAIDRTHRIGQDKPVVVYRLVSRNTIEEKVVALQQRKRELFDMVVESGAGTGAPLTADDIRDLLDLD